jgi:adenine phosphoribosyltransferase
MRLSTSGSRQTAVASKAPGIEGNRVARRLRHEHGTAACADVILLVTDATLTPVNELRAKLISEFRWRSDPPVWPESTTSYADYSGWWRDAAILSGIGQGLASLFPDPVATVVMGTESRGSLLGPLVACHLGIGFAEVRKEAERASDDDVWLRRRTPPDYRDRHLDLAVRRSVLRKGDRVLFVDDWAASGGQALACQQLVHDGEATWLGAAVIVDGLENSADRRRLRLHALLHLRDLRGR